MSLLSYGGFYRKAPAKVIEARKDAERASECVPEEYWGSFLTSLKLGYIDPTRTLEPMSEAERRAVLYLAYYAALRVR